MSRRFSPVFLALIFAFGVVLTIDEVAADDFSSYEETTASPTGPVIGFGVRGGLFFDLDGIFAGGQVNIGNLIPQVPALRFEGIGELGLGFGGVDFFAIRLMGHGKYLFELKDVPVTPFALAGLQLTYYNFDGGSNTELGLDIGGGVEYLQFGAELALGLGDVPDISLTGYYRF